MRRGAFVGALTTLGGIIGTVVNDPHILQYGAARIGVSVAVLGAIIQAVTKPLLKDSDE